MRLSWKQRMPSEALGAGRVGAGLELNPLASTMHIRISFFLAVLTVGCGRGVCRAVREPMMVMMTMTVMTMMIMMMIMMTMTMAMMLMMMTTMMLVLVLMLTANENADTDDGADDCFFFRTP